MALVGSQVFASLIIEHGAERALAELARLGDQRRQVGAADDLGRRQLLARRRGGGAFGLFAAQRGGGGLLFGLLQRDVSSASSLAAAARCCSMNAASAFTSATIGAASDLVVASANSSALVRPLEFCAECADESHTKGASETLCVDASLVRLLGFCADCADQSRTKPNKASQLTLFCCANSADDNVKSGLRLTCDVDQ